MIRSILTYLNECDSEKQIRVPPYCVSKMTQSSEIFSFSGILKILEIVFGFIALIIHRYGDYGKMIFFGTTNNKLQQVYQKICYHQCLTLAQVLISKFQNDDAIDAENLGNGVLVAYIVISSVLLVAYVIDGRYTIQSFFLEWVSQTFDHSRSLISPILKIT